MAETEQQSDDQRMAAVVLSAIAHNVAFVFATSTHRQVRDMLPPQDRWRVHPDRAAGVPVHTDARPVIDVHSEAFRDWFADSMMVDADGQPRSFWHGTFKDFVLFDGDPATRPVHRQERGGLYFTSSYDYACTYGYNVFEVCLKVRRPYVATDYAEVCRPTLAYIAQLRSVGYDAMTFTQTDGVDEICVFSPYQIRLLRRRHIGGLEPSATR